MICWGEYSAKNPALAENGTLSDTHLIANRILPSESWSATIARTLFSSVSQLLFDKLRYIVLAIALACLHFVQLW
jgi:hypothetical protein